MHFLSLRGPYGGPPWESEPGGLLARRPPHPGSSAGCGAGLGFWLPLGFGFGLARLSLRIWLDFGWISAGFWFDLDSGLILVWFDLVLARFGLDLAFIY